MHVTAATRAAKVSVANPPCVQGGRLLNCLVESEVTRRADGDVERAATGVCGEGMRSWACDEVDQALTDDEEPYVSHAGTGGGVNVALVSHRTCTAPTRHQGRPERVESSVTGLAASNPTVGL